MRTLAKLQPGDSIIQILNYFFSVTHFLNLGGDAMLVTPCPASDVDKQVYSSLAPFVRGAPREQVEQFWRTSAKVMLKHLKTKVLKKVTLIL